MQALEAIRFLTKLTYQGASHLVGCWGTLCLFSMCSTNPHTLQRTWIRLLCVSSGEFIHSFITKIYIEPLQGYYSEALQINNFVNSMNVGIVLQTNVDCSLGTVSYLRSLVSFAYIRVL